MRTGRIWLALSAAIVLCGQAAVPSPAAESLKIGVVDQQQVMERTKAGKRAMEGLKEYSVTRQRIVSADDEELKRLEKELKEQESGLSEEARRGRQKLFR